MAFEIAIITVIKGNSYDFHWWHQHRYCLSCCDTLPTLVIQGMQILHFHTGVTFFLHKFMDLRLKQELSAILRRKSTFLPRFKNPSLMWPRPPSWVTPETLSTAVSSVPCHTKLPTLRSLTPAAPSAMRWSASLSHEGWAKMSPL